MTYAAKTQDAFNRALDRVRATPGLKHYEDIILNTWDEQNTYTEHCEWVATAPTKEIHDWASKIDDHITEAALAEEE